MITSPCVSVLITTFNRAHFVGDAIASALNQSLTDIEIVVIDDGSTDATCDLLSSIDDKRFRYIRHQHNKGIPTARNTALSEARGKYIAWLDSDDIARPNRLAEQVHFLETHQDVAMVGSCAGKLHTDGRPKKGVRIPPFSPELISAWLLFRSAFQQSSILGRSSILKDYEYNTEFPVCEDVEMFLRLQKNHRLANLPRVLIDRRLHPEQSVRERRDEIADREMVIAKPLLDQLGMVTTEDNLKRHGLLGKVTLRGEEVPADFLHWAQNWFEILQKSNNELGVFDRKSLALACDYFWFLACRISATALGKSTAARAFVKRSPSGLFSSATPNWLKEALPLFVRR